MIAGEKFVELSVTPLRFPEVLEIRPKFIRDSRGFFSETYNEAEYRSKGVDIEWVQDNHSYSAQKGVLRGLHYQCEPFAQDKLVRVVRGAIIDFAVDIRKGSPTYGHYVSLEVSAEKWNQILLPKGFAHGLLTLEPDTEVLYKVSVRYSREHDRTIRYDDPKIGIDWPLNGVDPILSEKDEFAQPLSAHDTGFVYQTQEK